MTITIINETQSRCPKKFIENWMSFIEKELTRLKVHQYKLLKNSHVTIVLIERAKARKLNLHYRQKDYATDILSFSGDGRTELGDLVLCWPVLIRQAKEHDLSFNEELAYLLTHGVLHLLGYDHEKNHREEKLMLSLQDKVFLLFDRFTESVK